MSVYETLAGPIFRFKITYLESILLNFQNFLSEQPDRYCYNFVMLRV